MTLGDIGLFQSVRTRITLLMLGLVTLMLALFTYLTSIDKQLELKGVALHELMSISATIQGSLERELRSGIPDHVSELLAELRVNAKTLNAVLVNRQGIILFSGWKPQQGKPFAELIPDADFDPLTQAIDHYLAQYVYFKNDEKFIAYLPIAAGLGNVFNNEKQALIIEYSTGTHWHDEVGLTQWDALLFIGALLLISGCSWAYLDHMLSRRLKLLTRAIAMTGRPAAPTLAADISGHDEITLAARELERISAERLDYENSLLKFSMAVDQCWESIVITDLDANIEYVNQAFCRNSGYQASEVQGRNPRILRSGKVPSETYRDMWNNLLQGNVWSGELINRRKDGGEYIEWVTISPVRNKEGVVTHYLSIKKNVTEQLRLEIARDQAARMLDSFFDQALNLRVITGLDGVIQRVNSGWSVSLGYEVDELAGQQFFDLLHPEDRHHTIALLAALARGQKTEHIECRFRHKHEGYRIMSCAHVASDEDQLIFVEAIDITDRVRAETELHRLEYYDQLTRLPNKTFLLEAAAQHFASDGQNSGYGFLFVMALDTFRSINDVRGYEYGREVLREISRRIPDQLHRDCVFTRVGEDRFAGLTPRIYTDKNEAYRQATAMVDKLLAIVNSTMVVLDETVHMKASIGMTIYPDPATDAETLLRQADIAQHHAFDAGGNQHYCYHDSIGDKLQYDYDTEHELRQALRQGDLRLYIQPQVNYQGQLRGTEALVRWQHPRKGLIMPGAFIPVAEKSDLIVDLDAWVLIQALDFIALNQRRGSPISVSVNISKRHFRKIGFVSWLKGAIAKSGASPYYLILEVTEGLAIENLEDTINKMTELNKFGVRFSLDDFGTGYSSLSYLKQLPLHELKIDKSFINGVTQDQRDADIVDAILMVARGFGLQVVAEGVEEQEQADHLYALMDIVFQGYLYGRPTPVEEWLHDHSQSTCTS